MPIVSNGCDKNGVDTFSTLHRHDYVRLMHKRSTTRGSVLPFITGNSPHLLGSTKYCR